MFVLISNACWSSGVYNSSVPEMAVFQFQQLSLGEVRQVCTVNLEAGASQGTSGLMYASFAALQITILGLSTTHNNLSLAMC